MRNSKALHKTISFVLALTACSNCMFANAGSRFAGEAFLTAFAEEAEEAQEFGIDKTFLSAGDYLIIRNPDGYVLKVFADGHEFPADDFLLTEDFYEKWITVKAYNGESEEPVAEDKVYFSRLPVIYIDTKDGELPPQNDKSKKIDGNMYIQNNEFANKPVYSGKITLQGRGNTTWQWEKKPYKIKLDAKTDLYGMGKSKKYALLANYQDESLLRNTTASLLSEELGLTTMQTVWTDVILNGEYVGNYQLSEQVGIEKARVDMIDWEKEAEDAADKIADANGFSKKQKSALEDQMTEDLTWLCTDTIDFEGQNYVVSNHYNYSTDFTGGYLFESSEEYDEESKFKLNEVDLYDDEYVNPEAEYEDSLKIMMKSPEFLNTNEEMWRYVQTYWKTFENAYKSDDGYTETAEGDRVHYTDLADFDSMVSYWLLMEIMGNDDARYKSRYIYKPQQGLLTFGPPWDFDTGAGSILVRKDIDPSPTGWKVSNYNSEANFYREFLDDPFFMTAAAEKYWEIRPYLESVIKPGGQLEQNSDYLYESGLADAARWDRSVRWGDYALGYEEDTEWFKEYMHERIQWLDEQFENEDTLLETVNGFGSASPYEKSPDLIMDLNGLKADTVSEHAPADAMIPLGESLNLSVTAADDAVCSVDFYVNGQHLSTVDAADAFNKRSIDILPIQLYNVSGKKNVLSVVARDANGETVGRNYVTVVQTAAPEFKVRNLVLSGRIGVNFYMDLNSLTDEEKAESYMEFTVSGKTFTDPFDAEYMNLTHEYYGFTCYVNAVQMADTITAVFHYGDGETVEKTYSVLAYINDFEERQDQYSEETCRLIRSIADYGHYMQPFIAENNNWVIGEQYSEMTKSYTDFYDHDAIRDELAAADQAVYRDCGDSDIEKLTFALYPDAETAINVYIQPKEDYSGTITVNNGQYKAVRQEDGRYLVIIPNIAAHQLGRIFELNIATESGTATMRTSAMTYVYELLKSAAYQDNETAKNAVAAFYNYHLAADAYLESQNNN